MTLFPFRCVRRDDASGRAASARARSRQRRLYRRGRSAHSRRRLPRAQTASVAFTVGQECSLGKTFPPRRRPARCWWRVAPPSGVWAPRATAVYLHGRLAGAVYDEQTENRLLGKTPDGYWTGFQPGARAATDTAFGSLVRARAATNATLMPANSPARATSRTASRCCARRKSTPGMTAAFAPRISPTNGGLQPADRRRDRQRDDRDRLRFRVVQWFHAQDGAIGSATADGTRAWLTLAVTARRSAGGCHGRTRTHRWRRAALIVTTFAARALAIGSGAKGGDAPGADAWVRMIAVARSGGRAGDPHNAGQPRRRRRRRPAPDRFLGADRRAATRQRDRGHGRSRLPRRHRAAARGLRLPQAPAERQCRPWRGFRGGRHQPARCRDHGWRDDAGRCGCRCAAHAPSHLACPRGHGAVAPRHADRLRSR